MTLKTTLWVLALIAALVADLAAGAVAGPALHLRLLIGNGVVFGAAGAALVACGLSASGSERVASASTAALAVMIATFAWLVVAVFTRVIG